MNRTEIEIKLNRDRAWTLETWAAMSPDDLLRGLTVSRHAPESWWSAQDHLAHLAGIEAVFNGIIRRHIAGDPNPIGLFKNSDGVMLSHAEIMARVHAMNEAWINEHRPQSFSEIVALGQRIRAETLALLAELSDEQLLGKIPGAPWADGTVGGVLAVNGDHARQHYGWVTAGRDRRRPTEAERLSSQGHAPVVRQCLISRNVGQLAASSSSAKMLLLVSLITAPIRKASDPASARPVVYG